MHGSLQTKHRQQSLNAKSNPKLFSTAGPSSSRKLLAPLSATCDDATIYLSYHKNSMWSLVVTVHRDTTNNEPPSAPRFTFKQGMGSHSQHGETLRRTSRLNQKCSTWTHNWLAVVQMKSIILSHFFWVDDFHQRIGLWEIS